MGDVYDQVLGLLERTEIPLLSAGGDIDAIRKAICSGFFQNSARLDKGGTYRTGKTKQSAAIHPSSSLKDSLPKWVVFNELVFTTKEFMRNVLEIRSAWLVEVAPHMYSDKDVGTDGSGRR